MKLKPGEVIDKKYRIVNLLGQGGMGSVYEAENIRIQRRVAIKVLHQVRGQADIVRFEREARAAQIQSPHIVQIFDLGNLETGEPYLVMDLLVGETLDESMRRAGRMTPADLLPLVCQILDGLGAAHRAGIVHRDLKPENVFLVESDAEPTPTVKLLDFGISKYVDRARIFSEPALTKTGTAVGTPHYMSPEQIQGAKDVDARSDLYALGVILYRGFSGRFPFLADEVAPLLVQILTDVPPSLNDLIPDFDRELSAIVARAMAHRREERFQTAEELHAAIEDWQRGATRRAVFGNATTVTAPTGLTPAVAKELGAQRLGQRRLGQRRLGQGMLYGSSALLLLMLSGFGWLVATKLRPESAVDGTGQPRTDNGQRTSSGSGGRSRAPSPVAAQLSNAATSVGAYPATPVPGPSRNPGADVLTTESNPVSAAALSRLATRPDSGRATVDARHLPSAASVEARPVASAASSELAGQSIAGSSTQRRRDEGESPSAADRRHLSRTGGREADLAARVRAEAKPE